MKTLGNIAKTLGSNHATKRIGRGIGSGTGKTAGKGHKGQKARKGGGIAPGFEGGQTPLYRRIPKTGFTNGRNKIKFELVNLEKLGHFFSEGESVTGESLREKGVVKSRRPVKILGRAKVPAKLVVKVEKVTGGARQDIQSAGGSVEE